MTACAVTGCSNPAPAARCLTHRLTETPRQTAWCQTCGGNREVNVCPPSCNGSHVADYPRTCPDCAGTGLSSPSVGKESKPASSLVDPKGHPNP